MRFTPDLMPDVLLRLLSHEQRDQKPARLTSVADPTGFQTSTISPMPSHYQLYHVVDTLDTVSIRLLVG